MVDKINHSAYFSAMNNAISAIPHIREFNRFYTDIIGLLNQYLLDSSFSLAEARILYEINSHEGIQASQIMDVMHIDKSYLSRLLKKLEKEKVISRQKSGRDARAVLLTLTEKGIKEFSTLNKASDEQISNLMKALSGTAQEQLVTSMKTMMNIIRSKSKVKPEISIDDIAIRTQLLPGDLGRIAYLHGQLYAEECGYGLNFEGYVLKTLGEFAHHYDATKDRVWICEHNNSIIGALVGVHREQSVQLRYFIILPEYRGIGLAKKLMNSFMKYMQKQHITKAYLWTSNEQHVATALYKRYGFLLTEEKASNAFDKELIEQRYDLDLNKIN